MTVGESIAFLFENRETLLYQVQEMIRVEHISEPDKIQDELDTYNALLPQPRELSATMFIQITDQEHLKEQLDLLMGIDGDNVATLRLGSSRRQKSVVSPPQTLLNLTVSFTLTYGQTRLIS